MFSQFVILAALGGRQAISIFLPIDKKIEAPQSKIIAKSLAKIYSASRS